MNTHFSGSLEMRTVVWGLTIRQNSQTTEKQELEEACLPASPQYSSVLPSHRSPAEEDSHYLRLTFLSLIPLQKLPGFLSSSKALHAPISHSYQTPARRNNHKDQDWVRIGEVSLKLPLYCTIHDLMSRAVQSSSTGPCVVTEKAWGSSTILPSQKQVKQVSELEAPIPYHLGLQMTPKSGSPALKHEPGVGGKLSAPRRQRSLNSCAAESERGGC